MQSITGLAVQAVEITKDDLLQAAGILMGAVYLIVEKLIMQNPKFKNINHWKDLIIKSQSISGGSQGHGERDVKTAKKVKLLTPKKGKSEHKEENTMPVFSKDQIKFLKKAWNDMQNVPDYLKKHHIRSKTPERTGNPNKKARPKA